MASRVQKSMRNAITGAIGLFVNLIVQFIARSFFIRILGVEYNGVNGLFSNILQVLNLAELGFAGAVAYALYKPLKEHDEETVAALMRYFVRVYRIIAIIVAVVGAACIPFLQYLISEDISELPFSLPELRIYFSLYLINTVCSYLLAYKRTIITADQDAYIVSSVDNIGNICFNIIQIVLLYLTKNFYAYLSIMIAKTVVNNLIIHIIASKRYPYLAKYKQASLDNAIKKQLYRNIRALFCHKIGTVIIVSTSSIVLSAMVSIVDAGKYSNYTMVTGGVTSFIAVLFNGITASIGNLCVDGNAEYQYIVFKRAAYISYFLFTFTFVCFVCLFNDFIQIWLGSEMRFDLPVVLAISLNASILYLRNTVLTFKDAMGIYRQDLFKPILEAIVGIGLAIGLGFVWGTFGVVIGYTMATIVIAIPIESFVLFKFGLKRSAAGYFVRTLLDVVLAVCLTALTYYICTFIPDGIGWFILEFCFVVIFAAVVFLLLTCRTTEFKYYVSLAKQMVRKIFRRETAVSMANAESDSVDEKQLSDAEHDEKVEDEAKNEQIDHRS